jgi:hypothetical protein
VRPVCARKSFPLPVDKILPSQRRDLISLFDRNKGERRAEEGEFSASRVSRQPETIGPSLCRYFQSSTTTASKQTCLSRSSSRERSRVTAGASDWLAGSIHRKAQADGLHCIAQMGHRHRYLPYDTALLWYWIAVPNLADACSIRPCIFQPRTPT